MMYSKHRRTFLLFFSFFFFLMAKGNGGGFSIGVTATADPHFDKIKNITLLSERLNIRLFGKNAEVQADYLLDNKSSKSFDSLRYAFPIDICNTSAIDNRKVRFTSHLVFKLNGEEIPVDTLIESKKQKNGNARTWYYTTLHFPPGKVWLTVKYVILNKFGYDMTIDDKTFVHDYYPDCNYGIRTNNFNYDFSPAACWGDGKIKDFYLRIDASALDTCSAEKDDSPFYYHGPKFHTTINNTTPELEEDDSDKTLPFQKKNNIYTYITTDFDLNKIRNLHISYYDSQKNTFPFADAITNQFFAWNIKTSSERKGFAASNLADEDYHTTWIPSKNGGIGEWFEFNLDSTLNFNEFGFVNGYQKSETAYRENNRIKTVEVKIWYIDPELDSKGNEVQLQIDTINLEDRPYCKDIHSHSFWDFHPKIISKNGSPNMLFLSYEDLYSTIKQVRFTILDVYKGAKYNDTCVSEFLVGSDYSHTP